MSLSKVRLRSADGTTLPNPQASTTKGQAMINAPIRKSCPNVFVIIPSEIRSTRDRRANDRLASCLSVPVA